MKTRVAKLAIGHIVKHRKCPFRGVVFDVDPVFAQTEEWCNLSPKRSGRARISPSTICSPKTPKRNMLLVSEQNLVADTSATPYVIRKPTKCGCAAEIPPIRSDLRDRIKFDCRQITKFWLKRDQNQCSGKLDVTAFYPSVQTLRHDYGA